MKNIKELNLELIELENQFLLVEKEMSLSNNGDHYISYGSKNSVVHTWNTEGIHEGKQVWINKVIASTKQLDNIPLLVIEDEVDVLAKYFCEDWEFKRILGEGSSNLAYDCFSSGYNKAKSTFKFTEKDLKTAFQIARETLEYNEMYGFYSTKTEEEIIQSLTKKELWIEIENYCGSPYTTERCPKCVDSCDRAYQRPKITDGKIKAIWK